jgi:hypothetical protein
MVALYTEVKTNKVSEEEHDEAKAIFGIVCMIIAGVFAIYRTSGM